MSNDRIKILGISGSPRIGSTDFAVNEALRYAREKFNAQTDYFSVHKKTINFCIHCDYCVRKKEGTCTHKDDALSQELYPKLIWADAWIIGSPVYQGNVSAQTKAILDRCRALVAKDIHIFKNKVGGAIASGGDRIGGQEPTIKTIIDFYVINEMIPVGGGSFGANLGGTIWSKDKKAEGTKEDEEGLKSIHKMVKRLVKLTMLLNSTKQEG
ncbi:MAG: flavodoxin family protein [Promethearchaeota archaeon]